MPTSSLPYPGTSSSDKLGFTLFVAIALHALLIFGITFELTKGKNLPTTLEITLATHQSDKAPDKADFIAQHNQQGSGTGDRAQALTTEHEAEFIDNTINNTNPRPQVQAQREVQAQEKQRITTTGKSRHKIADHKSEDSPQEKRAGETAENQSLSQEIASLQAQLDRQRQIIANRPRVHRMTSVSAKSAVDAEYHYQWTRKVEFVGNRNFPQEALDRGIFGSLRLLTTLNPDGTIDSVKILHSSGHKVLDDAAIQIVHLASPFKPFPAEIRENFEKMEIIRTWHFEINGLSTTLNATDL